MIPKVICGASRVRTGDPLLAKQMRTSDYNTIERRYVNNGVS